MIQFSREDQINETRLDCVKDSCYVIGGMMEGIMMILWQWRNPVVVGQCEENDLQMTSQPQLIPVYQSWWRDSR